MLWKGSKAKGYSLKRGLFRKLKGPKVRTEITEERVRTILDNREKSNRELSNLTDLQEPIIQAIKDVNHEDYDRVNGLPEREKLVKS